MKQENKLAFDRALRHYIFDYIESHAANPSDVLSTAATSIFAVIAMLHGHEMAADVASRISQEVLKLADDPDVQFAKSKTEGRA